MMMIGIAAEDGLGAAAMNVAGPGALPMNVALGGLKAQESLGPTVDTDGAEATRMKTGTEVLPVIITEHTMNQGHVATLHPAPLRPPDPGPKAKRASPGPTAPLKISTQLLAPRNSQWGDLHPAPTLDPCLGHALAPGPGLAASLEVTDCLVFQSPVFFSLRMFLFGFQTYDN